MSLTAIILAGGKSTRMGQDKGLVYYRGNRLVEYVANVCSEITPNVLISTNNPDYTFLGYRLIPDIYQNLGPIGGIHAALSASESEDNFVCACDMPDVQAEDLKTILDKKNNAQVIVASDPNGKLYPVLGYYNKSILPIIEKQILTGDFKLQHLMKELKTQTIVFPEEKLKNMNYPEDLQ